MVPSKPAAVQSSDAFSNLLDLGSTGSQSKLSIAERQAQVERERRQKDQKEKEALNAQGAFWDSLASGNGLRPVAAQPKPVSQQRVPSPSPLPTFEDLTFDPLVPKRPMATPSTAARPVPSPKPRPSDPPPKPKVSVWDFDLLTTESTPTTAPTKTNSKPSFKDDVLSDFDLLADKPPSRSLSEVKVMDNDLRSDSPRSFDWGSREDGPQSRADTNGDGFDSDDEVMGILNKPASTRENKVSSHIYTLVFTLLTFLY